MVRLSKEVMHTPTNNPYAALPMPLPVTAFRLNMSQAMGLLEAFRTQYPGGSFVGEAAGVMAVFTQRMSGFVSVSDVKSELVRAQGRTHRKAAAACSEPGFVLYSVLTTILIFGDVL